MEAPKMKAISLLIVSLIVLSSLLFGIEQSVFLLIPRTDYSDHMASMFAMIVLTTFILILSKKRKFNLSILPTKFTAFYICASIAAVGLFITTPSSFTGGLHSIFLLVYASIVTPIFEEIIFRGYVWNKLNQIFSKEWKTYIVSTILFALWHFGYIRSIAFRVQGDLLSVMVWKVITGLCFGIVLGAVRLKTKNCYSTILLHGIMNIFGR